MSISPPVNLTAFTMSFYVESEFHPVNPYQIACYGDDGTKCALSVVIHSNMTLEISIVSTRYVYVVKDYSPSQLEACPGKKGSQIDIL